MGRTEGVNKRKEAKIMGRWLSRTEREARDKKIIELYHQGVTKQNIRLQFGKGVDIFEILRKHGIEPYRRTERIFSRLKIW